MQQAHESTNVQVVPLEPWIIAALAKPDMVIADDEWNDWGIPDNDYLCQCAGDIAMILDEEPVLNNVLILAPRRSYGCRDPPAGA